MMIVDNDLINKVLEKDTKEIAFFFDIEQDIVQNYKNRLYNIKKVNDEEKNIYKSTDLSVTLVYKRSLRYTLIDKMEELFGEYDKANDNKMAETIGISLVSLSNLVHKGHINKDDFSIVCNYLKPSKLLRKDWERNYVIQ